MTTRWRLFEANRRRYWNGRSDTIDVFRDTYGPTDLAVVFERATSREFKILLVQAKLYGELGCDRQRLKEFLNPKPETVELRIEYLEDKNKSCGHTNTTHTKIRTADDLDRHAEKALKTTSVVTAVVYP
jgi:hypothetical protein